MHKPADAAFKLGANVDVYLFPADFTYADYVYYKEQGLLNAVALQHDRGHNLVPTVGLNLIASRLTDNADNAPTHVGVGSGSTAAVAGNTNLQTAVGSMHAITHSYDVATGEAHHDTFYLSSENNGTIRESILANASSSYTIYARYVFASNFTKSTSNTMTIAWTITASAVAD